ncbi:IncV family inclusion membrane protein [Chlamydia pecorum]|uniref:Uncharacterized protein n=1 Tax=Chlamydia pecorum TaxID=85991 RepID=A0AA40PQ14_9CHLA|nr:IncV family inclusion membrane protein [Chlamydia pecorum]KTF28523.1 hypothetical protein cpL1_0558 [Chlamydia pecorum]KZN26816.1 hypothetical protein cpL71_0673 [Chlamydia pecorum]
MSNSVGSSTPQAPASSSVVSPQSGGARERLQRHTQGIFKKFFTIPDRHPKMRVVFDIAIIALSLIAIISILAATHGQGLLLYGLIPSALVGVFGVTLLISDLATSERLQRVADTATAILLPLIVLGIATALIASACLSAGGTALLLANPQFIMGVVTVGLFFISLSKVSCAHIKRELLDTTKKTETISRAVSPVPSLKDAKKIAEERKTPLSQKDMSRRHFDTEARKHRRSRETLKRSQGGVSSEDIQRSQESSSPRVSSDSSCSSSSIYCTPPGSPGSPYATPIPIAELQQESSSSFAPIDPAPVTSSNVQIVVPTPVYPPVPSSTPIKSSLGSFRTTPASSSKKLDKEKQDDSQQDQDSDKEKNKKKGLKKSPRNKK